MNAKILIRNVLLVIVAIAVGRWAMTEFGPAKATAGNGSKAVIRPDGVTVINFHGEKRCRTCIAIGTLARKTLDEDFTSELRTGKVRWEQINYDEATNAHYVNHYALVSSTILVTLSKEGKEVKWKSLDAVWDHVDDPPKFRAYISQGVRDLLDQP